MRTPAIPDAALDADIAILGKKGRGKTYAARGLVERLLEMKRRVLVLDPLSTWWGLRLAADGKREGFPIVVFGGPHADIPITDKSGAPLARALVADPIPAVVDLGLMRKGEQARFVADLLDELFAKNRQPLTIVLEEADAFAPQQPMNDMMGALGGGPDCAARQGLRLPAHLDYATASEAAQGCPHAALHPCDTRRNEPAGPGRGQGLGGGQRRSESCARGLRQPGRAGRRVGLGLST
jgi:hypothetical protein